MGAANFAYVLLLGLTGAGCYMSLPLPVVMVGQASLCVYIGSHLSASSDSIKEETMQAKDAYMFPVIGSCTLFGLYVLFKFVSKDWVNFLLGGYFFALGVWAVAGTFEPFVKMVAPLSVVNSPQTKWTFGIPIYTDMFANGEKAELAFNQLDLVCLAGGAVMGGFYVHTRATCDPSKGCADDILLASCTCSMLKALLSNMFGIAFSVQGIQHISVGSFKTGCILLTGLFFYDIFWVFGTEVMVTVAKNFDAPIKVLFLKEVTSCLCGRNGNMTDIVSGACACADGWSGAACGVSACGGHGAVAYGKCACDDGWFGLSCNFTEAQTNPQAEMCVPGPKFSMLGLGDIVIPGIFVALLLRFDIARYLAANPSAKAEDAGEGKLPVSYVYFHVQMFVYSLSLIVTVAVMTFFQAAQPALLYIVPFCLAGSFGTAFARGEFSDVWSYSEETEEESEEDKKKAEAESKKAK